MNNKLNNMLEEVTTKLNNITSLKELNDIRVEYLGKKGPISELTVSMRDMSIEEKKEFGAAINELKTSVTNIIEEKKEYLENIELEKKLTSEKIDVTLDSTELPVGAIHPLQRVNDQVCELFISMGYDVVEGPEIESDSNNFEKLNLPKGHPARDAQDSFYITEEFLLRTHTSPVQARTMEANLEKGPLRIICPGKTYRRDDDDATHSHQFQQVEGLVVDEGISMSHLKGTLEVLIAELFGEGLNVRFRPSYFPFTEPSIEVDISCFKCGGSDHECKICKGTGWIEIGGAGMVHPRVLEMSGYDSKKYSGFAFGMGFERIAMLKYGINDIRHFYTNDLRILNDFKRKEGGN